MAADRRHEVSQFAFNVGGRFNGFRHQFRARRRPVAGEISAQARKQTRAGAPVDRRRASAT
jgi:hypothetical protein